MKQESKKDVKIPKQMNAHIRDMTDPIIVRRVTVAKVGAAVLALLVVGAVSWQLLFSPPTGEELLAEVIDAAGGMQNWNKIEQGTYTRTKTIFGENGQPLEEFPSIYSFKKGSEYRLLIQTTNELGPIEIGFDGNDYWAVQNGQPVDPKQLARKQGYMCESENCTPLCSAEMSFYRFSIPFKMTDPGVIPNYVGASVLNGSPVSHLEITFDESVGRDRWVLFVNDETELIHKVEHYSRISGDVPPEQIYWSDHQEEFGITFSHRNTYYRSNGKKLEEFNITNVDFSSPIADNKFQRPGA